MKFIHITRHTRAGSVGKIVKCPSCGTTQRIFHFAWEALGCPSCNKVSDKAEWLVEKTTKRDPGEDPSAVEALALGRKVTVNSESFDFWASFSYDPNCSQVTMVQAHNSSKYSTKTITLPEAQRLVHDYATDGSHWYVYIAE